MIYLVIEHKQRKVNVFHRKMSAIYKHVEFKIGDKVQYKECDSLPKSLTNYQLVTG